MLLLLSAAPVGAITAMTIPPARLAEGLKALADVHARLLASVNWHPDVARHAATGTTPVQTTRLAAPAPVIPAALDRNLLVYGDRLKVSFYESLGVTLDEGGASPAQAVATIFPRMDLSAEYTVDEDGSLVIPRLGRVNAAGQSITAVRSALAAAFVQSFGRPSDVNIDIIERQPVYVIGTVRNTGTFRYVPGMTVLHALANAGGLNSGVVDTSRAIESIRETQRLHQMEAKLDRLLIHQARLGALREDADSLAVPSSLAPRLSKADAQDGLKTLVAGAQAILTVERATYHQQLSLAERQVGIARTELGAQNLRAAQLDALLVKKAQRLRELEAIAAHGSVSQVKLSDVGVDISEVVARREDLRVALAQSDRRLVEAEIALAKIQLDHSAGIEKELSVTQEDIDDCTQAIASMRAVTLVLRDGGPDLAGVSGGAANLRITRRMADGLTVMPATESTALLPGDVVQVNPAGGFDAGAAGPARKLTYLQN